MPKIVKKAATKTATKNRLPKKSADDARKVASASEGSLSPDQVRVLRCLLSGRPARMAQLKAAIGLSPEQKYSGKFLDGVHALKRRHLLTVSIEGRSHLFEITPKGKELLRTVVKEATVIAKHQAKKN